MIMNAHGAGHCHREQEQDRKVAEKLLDVATFWLLGRSMQPKACPNMPIIYYEAIPYFSCLEGILYTLL